MIINDFSDDDTLDKANSLSYENKKFKVLNNKKKGLGGAVNLGIKESNGSKIVIMMADQSDDLDDLIKYNDIIDKEGYDAVLGSRFLKAVKSFKISITKISFK